MTPWTLPSALLVQLVASGAPAQTAEFLAAAHAATARYRDPRVAIADGYRAIGPDFPGMGEHWVHPGLLVGGQLDAAHPQILEYAVLQGRRSLVGLAYTAVVRGDEVPHAFPVSPAAWHFHSGTVDEESFVLSHIGAGHEHAAGPRLAVLHAWVWLENPAGVFATDNWALPYERLGLHAPPGTPVAAARALSLASGGDAYLEVLVRVLGRPDSSGAAALPAVIIEYRGKVAELVQGVGARAELGAREVIALAQLWGDLCDALTAAAGPEVAERLKADR